jgi:hypothetical protein
MNTPFEKQIAVAGSVIDTLVSDDTVKALARAMHTADPCVARLTLDRCVIRYELDLREEGIADAAKHAQRYRERLEHARALLHAKSGGRVGRIGAA